LELLNIYSIEFGFENAISLLETYIKKTDSLYYNFKLSDVLNDANFWTDKVCKDLVGRFYDSIQRFSSDRDKYNLFLKGYLKEFPLNYIIDNIEDVEIVHLQKVFQSIPENKKYIKEVLELKAIENPAQILGLYFFAIKYLDSDEFSFFDEKIFANIPELIE
jgi:hypothetical protein